MSIDMATTKIYIVYYSVYGHVEVMAREVQRGANSVEGVEATLWQVPETLSSLILQKMKAPPKPNDVPVIRPDQLLEADGFLFGFPSRFGVMAAQCKAFFDATTELWASQALAGKPAGIFWSTGFHGGGQELTAWTAITQLAHHGMLFVPLGYTFGSGMFEMDQVKGGSSYGAGTFAADGSRQPTKLELQQAFHQGSGGSFGPARVKEIATGLEQSECKFWYLRVSSPNNKVFVLNQSTNDDFPEGFMERIRGRGMACSWAPPVEALAHKAIGGFESHCGWNSILESLWYGVPIVK